MKIIFSILFILSSMIGGNLTKPMESIEMENSVSYVEDNVNTYDLSSGVNEFTGSATALTLNNTTTAYFNYPSSKMYFSFVSTEQQFVKLNYTGLNSKLYVYNSYYYSANDYLQYIPNVKTDIDIVYMDMNQTYIFEFTNISSYGQMSITPQKLDINFVNHEKYILHIEYDTTSNLKHHYSVEYYDVSLTEAEDTPYNIYTNTSVATYIDLISNDINFNYVNDDRRLVSQPGYSHYSAIAAVRSDTYYDGSSLHTQGYGTGTFIDETTVISCAHMMYKKYKNLNGVITDTTLVDTLEFYPGANSYPNKTNHCEEFGKYVGLDTYVPISYVLSSDKVPYDWSITLTEQTIEGLYEHSYMGLINFNATTYSGVESAGYPCVSNNATGEYNLNYSMWTSYPTQNSITTNNNNINILESTDIVVSNGNSGGPLFVSYSSVVNGVVIKSAFILGIADAILPKKNADSNMREFVTMYACRIRPIIINIYEEVK